MSDSLAITSDVAMSRSGVYYRAITRKGKTFIAKTGVGLEQIGFSSKALGDEKSSTAFADHGPSTLYGHLHKIRKRVPQFHQHFLNEQAKTRQGKQSQGKPRQAKASPRQANATETLANGLGTLANGVGSAAGTCEKHVRILYPYLILGQNELSNRRLNGCTMHSVSFMLHWNFTAKCSSGQAHVQIRNHQALMLRMHFFTSALGQVNSSSTSAPIPYRRLHTEPLQWHRNMPATSHTGHPK